MNKQNRTVLAITILLILFVAVLLMNARSAGSPFTDVAPDAWYAEAVEWAAAEGITNGTAPGYFSPDKVCTRAEMVTFLHRLAKSMEEGTNEIDPDPTPEPRTLADLPYGVPQVEQRIVPGYEDRYYGRMTIGGIYSVGLYDTLSQALVDESDAAFWMREKDGCQMVGDHDGEGLWIIRWCGPGDTLEIRKADGEYQKYKWVRTDPHVTNKGSDVWDANGESLFFQLPESGLFICTCNDSTGKDMTATFWVRCG